MNKRDSDILSLEPVVARNARRFSRNFRHSSVDFLSVAWLAVIQEYDRGNCGAECDRFYSVVVRNRIISELRNEAKRTKNEADNGAEHSIPDHRQGPAEAVEYDDFRLVILKTATRIEVEFVQDAEAGNVTGVRPFAAKHGFTRHAASVACERLRRLAVAASCMR